MPHFLSCLGAFSSHCRAKEYRTQTEVQEIPKRIDVACLTAQWDVGAEMTGKVALTACSVQLRPDT